jgi:hypothetical protein
MTDTADPEHSIFLFALEDAESVPLRRWLGREAWRADPEARLRYDADGDRIVFRLVDTPSTAVGYVNTGHPPDPDPGMFLGFDGVTGPAWPTTIALLDFCHHCDQETSQLSLLRDLVGSTALREALALRDAAGGERTVRIPPDEADGLISRWVDLIVAVDAELDDALAEWSTAVTTQEPAEPAADQPARPDASGALLVPQRELAVVTASDMSRATAPERSSFEGGRPTGRRSGVPESTGRGEVMARKSLLAADGGPLGALPYGLRARLTDAWAGRRDGRAGVPPLPAAGDPAGTRHGITPYLEIRNRHFLDCAERERQRMLTDLEETYRAFEEVRQEIAAAEEHADATGAHRKSLPDAPADLSRRNMLEKEAPEELVRARRQREHDAKRAGLAAQEQQARQAVGGLHKREASLSRAITTRERLFDSRVRQLLQHSRQRCGTYLRHLAHHHPDGSAVIHYLDLALPDLPKDWPVATNAANSITATNTPPPDGSAEPRTPWSNAG